MRSLDMCEAEKIRLESGMGAMPPIESILSSQLLPLTNQREWKHHTIAVSEAFTPQMSSHSYAGENTD
jgi:hypothetical protein